MPNQENYTSFSCTQQYTNNQQYSQYIYQNNYNSLQNHNMYDLMYSNQTKHQTNYSNNISYDHADVGNWFPDPRIIHDLEKGLKLGDKIETIEISSKDLSPASCCSNIDLLLPEIHKINSSIYEYQWSYGSTYNKSFSEYPSCSQINSEKAVKHIVDGNGSRNCNYMNEVSECIQSSSECKIFNQFDVKTQENTFLNLELPNQNAICSGVVPFDSIPNTDSEQWMHMDKQCNGTEDTNEESDIIVEESDEGGVTDYSEEIERRIVFSSNCVVCDTPYSPIGSQFYILKVDTPLTMSSQKPVLEKLIELVGTFDHDKNYLCSQCLGLINTIDHLQMKLTDCKKDLIVRFEKSNPEIVSINKTGGKRKLRKKCTHNFLCKLCQRIITVRNIYKRHMLNHKKCSFQRVYLCEICGQKLKKVNQFKRHLEDHTVNLQAKTVLIRAFECRVCSKTFRTRSNLTEHENYCSGKLPYRCKICDKKFASSTKLKSHNRLKHDKKFTSICSICNIGFVHMSHYKAHMISHGADKKFSCNLCDKAYKTLSNLKFHRKFHAAQLPYSCTVCNKSFMRKEYLESHIAIHTGVRNFICTTCNRRFSSQKNLDAHVKIHDTGHQRKKPCNVCGKTIAGGLEDHMRTHANLKEFECEYCDMRFNTKGAYFKHRKRKHSDYKRQMY